MITLIAVILGIFFVIANVNSWFVVPAIIVKGCFVFAAVVEILPVVIAGVTAHVTKNERIKMWRNFKR